MTRFPPPVRHPPRFLPLLSALTSTTFASVVCLPRFMQTAISFPYLQCQRLQECDSGLHRPRRHKLMSSGTFDVLRFSAIGAETNHGK